MNLILSFFAGSLVTIIGAYINYLFQRKSEKRKNKEKLRFEIYMNLLDISASYFWISSAEVRNVEPYPDTLKRINDLTWKTCDKLREVDDIEFLDEILDILFSEKFKSAFERTEAFYILIEKLQKVVNPKLTKK